VTVIKELSHEGEILSLAREVLRVRRELLGTGSLYVEIGHMPVLEKLSQDAAGGKFFKLRQTFQSEHVA
jgi:hypothetical protein